MDWPLKGIKIIHLYDRVIDKISNKKGVIVYISDPPVEDAYVFEPEDNSFDPVWREIDDLEKIPK